MSFKIKWQVPEDATSVKIYHSDYPVSDLNDAKLVELAGDATEYDLEAPERTFYRVEVVSPEGISRSGWNAVEHVFKVPGIGSDRIAHGDSQYGVAEYGYLTQMFKGVNFGTFGATFSGDPKCVKMVYRGRTLYLIGGSSFIVTIANLYSFGFCDFQHPDDKAAAVARGEKLENLFTYNGEVYKLRLAKPYAYDDPKTSAEMAAATPIFWPNSEMADIPVEIYNANARGLGDDMLVNKDGSVTIEPNVRAAIRAGGPLSDATATAPAYSTSSTTIRQSYKGARSLWTVAPVTGNVTLTNLLIEYVGPLEPQA